MKASKLFLVAMMAFMSVFARAAILKDILEEAVRKSDDANAELLLTVANFIGDDEREAMANEKMEVIEGRESEADQILDTLVRMKSRTPVLVAPPGVGKTAIVQRAIQKTIERDYPQTEPFKEVLDNAHWIQLTPGGLLRIIKTNNDISRMKAIEDIFSAIAALEKKFKINIICFRDEFHSLDSAQVEALLPLMESQSSSIRLVGATNADKLTLSFGKNQAFLRRIRPIAVPEFDDETTLRLVNVSWVPKIQKKYSVRFTDDAKNRFIRFGTILYPDGGKFDAAIKLAQDMAIWNQRKGKDAKDFLTQDDVFAFFKSKTNFPVDPFNQNELNEYLTDLNAKISAKLVGQSRMINDVIEVFRDVILGTKKDMGVIVANGPTGTGKSELGKLLAIHGFNNPHAYLKIDANEYASDGAAIKKLLGAEAGLVTSDTRSGVLSDYFDDPSKGKYGGVIVIDEAEKASPKFWERLMEFFEEGSYSGGDGKIRKANRHIVMLTSNRGDTILFPESMKKLAKAKIMEYANKIDEAQIKRVFQTKLNGRDEFHIPSSVLNRVDRWTVSVPTHDDDIDQIAENYSRGKIAEIVDIFQVKVEIEPEIVRRIGHVAFDPQYGARPIERALNRYFADIKSELLKTKVKFKGEELDIRLNELSADDSESIVTIGAQEAFRVGLPRLRMDEPLLSTTLKETILNISKVLPARVIGQPDALKRIKGVLINYLSSPAKTRGVLSILLLGLTGVGKTETAKATAEAVFGSADRAEIISFTDVGHESDYNRIVGSPPGYVGSEEIRAFERALMNHPDGGVIVLDEVTNIGGKNKDVKEALLLRMLNMFEEGKWTSAATGTTYDLTKYIFFQTGNDGQELFPSTSDEVRLQTWKDFNKPEKLHKLLVSKGVPEPFLGRQADTILYKPLLRSETTEIAHKLLAPVFERYEKLGYRIDVAADFDAEIGRRFFTQSKGARSIRTVVQNRMNSLISESLILSEEQLKGAKDKWIRIEIIHNIDSKPFIEDKSYRAQVNVNVRVGYENKEIQPLTLDVTQFAALDKKLSKEQALATAHHEAGHAVLNDPEETGMDLKFLTILGSEGNIGFALYGDDGEVHRYAPTDKRKMLAALARVLGGQVAMVMAGSNPDNGWSSDIDKGRDIVQKYVLKWALNQEFLAVMTDDKGKPIYSQEQINKATASMDKIMREAIDIAVVRLTQKWDLVEAVVNKLMTDGYANEAEFKEMSKEWKAKFEKGPVAIPPVKDCAAQLLGEAA